MSETSKLFPLKLPDNFHGPTKAFKRATQLYAERTATKVEGYPTNKISNWKRKILDKDIVSERQQYLVHPAKISQDNPDWVKSTFHHFHRNHASLGNRQSLQEKKKFDVFGNQKIDPTRNRSEKEIICNPRKQKPQVTPKVGFQSTYEGRYPSLKASIKSQISGKIGSIENRQGLIRKPQLKVGSLHHYNFVDTYSVN